jgi:hypothetical protein
MWFSGRWFSWFMTEVESGPFTIVQVQKIGAHLNHGEKKEKRTDWQNTHTKMNDLLKIYFIH